MVSRTKDDAASLPDEDNPEWTLEEMRTARPVAEVVEEVFGAEAARPFKLRQASVRRQGLQEELRGASWETICDMTNREGGL